MQLKLFFFLASVVITARAATIADVLTQLDVVKARVLNLGSAVNAFPNSGGCLIDALDIHSKVALIKSVVDTATSDANTVNTPVSESDGQNVLQAIVDIEPVVGSALIAIAAKKTAFESLPVTGVSGLVKQDLISLRDSILAFEGTLISMGPADMGDQANAMKSSIDNAFTDAIAAYS